MEMDAFCDGVMHYVNTEDSVDKVIALTLRDIFLNELIYVQYFDVWKQYDTTKKQWSDFPVKEFHDKLSKLRAFFSTSLPEYVERQEDTTSAEVRHLKMYMALIDKYMSTTEGEQNIIEQCKECFYINV